MRWGQVFEFEFLRWGQVFYSLVASSHCSVAVMNFILLLLVNHLQNRR